MKNFVESLIFGHHIKGFSVFYMRKKEKWKRVNIGGEMTVSRLYHPAWWSADNCSILVGTSYMIPIVYRDVDSHSELRLIGW